MAKGQGKGQSFEREICTRLSLWWSDGKRDDIFWRTAGSGARATVRGKSGRQTMNQHGDIMATCDYGTPLIDLFTIELKRGYSDATCHEMLDCMEKTAELHYERWITNAIRDCSAAGAAGWLLIAKRDRRLPLIWMESETMLLFSQVGVSLVIPPCATMTVRLRKQQSIAVIFGMTLDNFLLNVTPRTIIELGKIV